MQPDLLPDRLLPAYPDCPTATARGRPHSRRRQQLLRRRGGIPGRTGQSRRHPADRREPLHRGLLAGAPLGERQQGTSRIRLPQELRRRAVQHPQDLPPVGIAGRTVGLHYGPAGQPEFRPIRHLLPLHALPAAIPAHTRNQSRGALRHPSGLGLCLRFQPFGICELRQRPIPNVSGNRQNGQPGLPQRAHSDRDTVRHGDPDRAQPDGRSDDPGRIPPRLRTGPLHRSLHLV